MKFEDDDFWNDDHLIRIRQVQVKNIPDLSMKPLQKHNLSKLQLVTPKYYSKPSYNPLSKPSNIQKFFKSDLSESKIRIINRQNSKSLYSSENSKNTHKTTNFSKSLNKKPHDNCMSLIRNNSSHQTLAHTNSNKSISNYLLKKHSHQTSVLQHDNNTLSSSLSRSKINKSVDSSLNNPKYLSKLKKDLLLQTKTVLSQFMMVDKNRDLLKNSALIKEMLNGDYLLNKYIRNESS